MNAATTAVNSLHSLYGGEVTNGFTFDDAAAYRSANLKADGKILSRLRGGLGAVLMVIEFVECMF